MIRIILYNSPEPNLLLEILQFFFGILKQIFQTNMTSEWDTVKPIDMNEKSWRRKQIVKFMNANPNCKPKDVFAWIMSQIPNP